MKTKFLCIVLLLTLSSAVFAQPASALENKGAFSEEFDGQTLDDSKWVMQLNSGLTGNPSYGGNVTLDNGKIFLSSNGTTFPYITTLSNPFPETGDFTLNFIISYDRLDSYGCGFWVSNGEHTSTGHEPLHSYPLTRTPEPTEVRGWANILQVWGGVYSGIFAIFLGKWHVLFPPATAMDGSSLNFRLEYIQEKYYLYMDEKLVAQETSDLRPDHLGFGHEPSAILPLKEESIGVNTWSAISLDYIRVLDKSVLSLNTEAESATIGDILRFDGNLTDTSGNPLGGKTIFIQYALAGLDEWNKVSSATTNTDGSYSAAWLTTGTGNFMVRASWTGDESYAGSEATRNVSVTQSEGETFFYAESNSTLSSLSFNSTSNEIYFTVSGLNGTTGYVRFLISKTIITDINTTKIFLDAQQINCSISSLRDYWQIYFTYHHSTHDVVIKIPEMNLVPKESAPLTPQSTPQSPQIGSLVGFLLVVPPIIAVGAIILMYSKRRKN